MHLIVYLQFKAHRLGSFLVVDDVHLLGEILRHGAERRAAWWLYLQHHVLLGSHLHANTADRLLCLVQYDRSDCVTVVCHHVSGKFEAEFDGRVFEGGVGWEGWCRRLHIAEQVAASGSASSENVTAAEWICLLLLRHLRLHTAAKEVAHWVHGIGLLWWPTKSHAHQVIGVLLGHAHAHTHIKEPSTASHWLVLGCWSSAKQVKET